MLPSAIQNKAESNPSVLSFGRVWIASILLSLTYFLVGYNRFLFIFANTYCGCYHCCVDLYQRQDIQVPAFTSSPVGKFSRQYRRKPSQKASGKMGEKDSYCDISACTDYILACYLPSCVCIYIVNLCTSCDCAFIHWVRDIQFVLVMADSGVNPFVYAWRLENFRKAFKNLLTCRAVCKRMRSFSVNLQSTIQSKNGSLGTTAGRFNSGIEINDLE